MRCVFSANDPEDRAAANTAAELNKIHNEVPWGRDLRDAIHRSFTDVLRLILALKEATGPHREQVRAELRTRLSRRAPFTALLRAAVADYADVASLFD